MGRSYEGEIQELGQTAVWAAGIDMSRWAAAIARLGSAELVIVASGGSVAAAIFIAQLHTTVTGHLAVVMTPLEFVTERSPICAAALFVSAGGSNSDILGAWEAASHRGIRKVGVLCANQRSPLATLAQEARIDAAFCFDLPAGGDGFLATNSLVAFVVIALRMYGFSPTQLPDRPRTLAASDFLQRRTLVVLYGGWLKSVAMDLESRFTEAALASVQLADFRNFAHGRHHWLAKRGEESAVIALISPAFSALADDTLALLPQNIPIQRWSFSEDSPVVVLQGLQRSIELAGLAAARLGYDAGRPGVPDFDHRIYNLKAAPLPAARSARECALDRKFRALGRSNQADRDRIVSGLAKFQASLAGVELRGLVLDYDGTIVATERRFEEIQQPIAAQLNRLLDDGLVVGIATGRGRSIHEKLCAAINRQSWGRCLVGYYNGAVIRALEEGCEGLAGEKPDPAILAAELVLRQAPELFGARIDARPSQISVTLAEADEKGLWMKVRAALERSNLGALKVVHSSHSVDVIPNTISKAAVVERVAQVAGGSETELLKIGDRGLWPGNDSELLAMSHGLSVDQVSASSESCWNLAPQELVGPDATLYYLRLLVGGRFELAIPY